MMVADRPGAQERPERITKGGMSDNLGGTL
jgi:hypothetical protein